MIYLIFETQSDAEAALTQIDTKVREAVANYNSQAIDEGGIIPRNAATGQLETNATRTSSWAIAQQRLDGKWCFPKITPDYHPLFTGVDFLEEITCTEEEYNPDWFAQEVD